MYRFHFVKGLGHIWNINLWVSFQLKLQFLHKILNQRWNVCHVAMARENWVPLCFHKAIHCWKWKICLQHQGSTSANAQSKQEKTGTYITLRDCGMTTKGILPKKIILTPFEEKGNSYWSTAGVNSSGKYHIKAPSTLWLGCFSNSLSE